jgi:hypothetical protein
MYMFVSERVKSTQLSLLMRAVLMRTGGVARRWARQAKKGASSRARGRKW